MGIFILSSLASDAAGKLDVLGHDGDTLGVNGTQVGVLEEANKVRFGRLLQSHEGRGLESQLGLEILRNLPHKALEGKLANEEFGRLLVLANLTKCHCTRSVPVGLLHASLRRS